MSSTPKDTKLTYDEALAWLFAFESRGSQLGLERITKLLECCHNPQHTYPTIHITGTNGKGSLCHYLTSVFVSAGYKVGLYISPHLERFTERIRINQTEIPHDEFASLVSDIKPLVEHLEQEGVTLTFFEVVTALAFVYFAQHHVDYAIIEVGLGGRFDATNVITPLVSVITNVTLEHQNVLGNTLEKIAYEKAGIIKSNVPVVTAAVYPALDTIQRIAQELKAPVYTVSDTIWRRESVDDMHQEFIVNGLFQEYQLTTRLLGKFQGENIACAVVAIELLQQQGVFFPEGSIQQGITLATNPGRMEFLRGKKPLLLDGAHNVSGLSQLKSSLQQDFSYRRLILIIGILKDKDINAMVSVICPLAHTIICTQSSSPRACSAIELQEIIRKQCGILSHVEPDISKALALAEHLSTPDDLLCVTGSLFTVGQARLQLVEYNRIALKE